MIHYYYDASGVIGFKYGQDEYLYVKDALGSIIEILDINGKAVGSYEYDAFGKCSIKTGFAGIAAINPFRYRGYYMDIETGWYYLQTRYYDPSVRRFINSDNYELIGELAKVVGYLNMYAYCNNNPIMNVDPTGEGWWKDFWSKAGKVTKAVITGVAVIAAVVVTAGAIALVAGVAATLIGGAIAANAAAIAACAFIGGVTAGVGAYLSTGFEKGFSNINSNDFGSIICKTIVGSTAGAVSGMIFTKAAVVGFGIRLVGNLSAWAVTTTLNPGKKPIHNLVTFGMAVGASFTPWNWYGTTAGIFGDLLNLLI